LLRIAETCASPVASGSLVPILAAARRSSARDPAQLLLDGLGDVVNAATLKHLDSGFPGDEPCIHLCDQLHAFLWVEGSIVDAVRHVDPCFRAQLFPGEQAPDPHEPLKSAFLPCCHLGDAVLDVGRLERYLRGRLRGGTIADE
jgi:hypothetical protein